MSNVIDLRINLRDSLLADDMGLYEAFWEVSDGEFYDADFKISKSLRWEDVRDVLVDMSQNHEIHICSDSENDRPFDDQKSLQILRNKENWRPFELGTGRGYILSVNNS